MSDFEGVQKVITKIVIAMVFDLRESRGLTKAIKRRKSSKLGGVGDLEGRKVTCDLD